MESPTLLGIAVLVLAIFAYVSFAIAVILLGSKKTVMLGLIGILAVTSATWALAAVANSVHLGQPIDTSLIVPLFGLTASIALAVRYRQSLKNQTIWSQAWASLRTNWRQALGIFVVAGLAYGFIATLFDWPKYLHAPLIIGGLVMLLKHTVSGARKTES